MHHSCDSRDLSNAEVSFLGLFIHRLHTATPPIMAITEYADEAEACIKINLTSGSLAIHAQADSITCVWHEHNRVNGSHQTTLFEGCRIAPLSHEVHYQLYHINLEYALLRESEPQIYDVLKTFNDLSHGSYEKGLTRFISQVHRHWPAA